jgi:hypothetical protein
MEMNLEQVFEVNLPFCCLNIDDDITRLISSFDVQLTCSWDDNEKKRMKKNLLKLIQHISELYHKN